MAHSYIYAENVKTERSVAVPDSTLCLFMYFFNETSRQNVGHISSENEICEHYNVQVLDRYVGCMDAELQRVSEDSELKTWYLSMLMQLEILFDRFGAEINMDYLNAIPELNLTFIRSVPISQLKNLINDIYWILNETAYFPSGQYKWFEKDND